MLVQIKFNQKLFASRCGKMCIIHDRNSWKSNKYNDSRTVILAFIFKIFSHFGKASNPEKFHLSRQIFQKVIKQDSCECPPKRICNKGLVLSHFDEKYATFKKIFFKHYSCRIILSCPAVNKSDCVLCCSYYLKCNLGHKQLNYCDILVILILKWTSSPFCALFQHILL